MESGERMIYRQVADFIEDGIITGVFVEDEPVPSTNQLARTYRINPATAAKGMASLIDKGVLYKKRGLGMYVAVGARDRLMRERIDGFLGSALRQFANEAKRLGVPKEELFRRIEGVYKNGE